MTEASPATARAQHSLQLVHASTQVRKYIQHAASTPVKHEFPHPHTARTHAQKHAQTTLYRACRVACAVSLFCTSSPLAVCSTVTRQRAYTATGQKNVQENQQPHACTHTANPAWVQWPGRARVSVRRPEEEGAPYRRMAQGGCLLR